MLKLDRVAFAYDPTREVLRDCSIAVAKGERVGLIGSNGSGKTTLLHLVMGLEKPTGGTIEILGTTRAIESDFVEVRRRVGLLFQNSDDQLFCPTVFEDVAFGPLNLGKTPEEAAAIVTRVLAQLGLDGFEDRITYKMSNGEKRLVALATILAMDPDLLLLDEPTAGLDEEHEARLIDVLRALPHAMVIVSHNRPFLDALATRVATLRNGAIA